MKSLRIAIFSLFLATAGMAQVMDGSPNSDNRDGRILRGEILSGGFPSGLLTVELTPAGGGIPARATVNPDGSFEVRAPAAGMYELVVMRGGETVSSGNYVSVPGYGERVFIRLTDPPKTAPPGQLTVSAKQLGHEVPGSAQKAFNRGRSASAKGDTAEASRQFQKAVEIDPEFAEAYNDLGALAARQGDLPKAEQQFRKAVSLVPDHRLALSNLCLVLGKMDRYDEAGDVAREALRVDPANLKVHFILAISLIARAQDAPRALNHLQRAAEEIPLAHLVAAELLMESGQQEAAQDNLEAFLRKAPATDRHRARAQELLARLRK